MTLGCFGFSVMNILIRYAAAELDPLQIAFFRNFFALVLMLPWLARHFPEALVTGRFKMHLARALFGLTAMLLWFFSISVLPLSEAVALNFTVPLLDEYIRETFYFVQINMFGDLEVTDFDGTVLPEQDMVSRWGVLFTPTVMYFPHEVEEGLTAPQAAVANMPGAFSANTTLNLLHWVDEEIYLTDEPFQKYHARMIGNNGL